MNSPNHILIATIVYEYIKDHFGIVLDKSSFLKGNTCPDHGISFLRPHRIKYCNRMVRKKTIKLCSADRGVINEKASKKIGILCHYYSDFFCYAHSPKFGGSLKDHIRYEDGMLQFMYENYSEFQKIEYVPNPAFPLRAADINNRMRRLIYERTSLNGDYGMELVCAIQACSELVLYISLAMLYVQGELAENIPLKITA